MKIQWPSDCISIELSMHLNVYVNAFSIACESNQTIDKWKVMDDVLLRPKIKSLFSLKSNGIAPLIKFQCKKLYFLVFFFCDVHHYQTKCPIDAIKVPRTAAQFHFFCPSKPLIVALRTLLNVFALLFPLLFYSFLMCSFTFMTVWCTILWQVVP